MICGILLIFTDYFSGVQRIKQYQFLPYFLNRQFVLKAQCACVETRKNEK